MAIHYHPEQGTILICDFVGLKSPEMVKRRPVVVVSPRSRSKTGLCTIVPCSTTEPLPLLPYHHKLYLTPQLPKPYDSHSCWVKADMIYTVSFDRLSLPHNGKDAAGKRIYDIRVLDKLELAQIQQCMLISLGLTL